MVRPAPGRTEMVPIRHGDTFVLGCDAASSGRGSYDVCPRGRPPAHPLPHLLGGPVEGDLDRHQVAADHAGERDLGADTVVGVSLQLETVADKAQALMISGTAVRTRARPVPAAPASRA